MLDTESPNQPEYGTPHIRTITLIIQNALHIIVIVFLLLFFRDSPHPMLSRRCLFRRLIVVFASTRAIRSLRRRFASSRRPAPTSRACFARTFVSVLTVISSAENKKTTTYTLSMNSTSALTCSRSSDPNSSISNPASSVGYFFSKLESNFTKAFLDEASASGHFC